MITCACDFCGKEIKVPDNCIIDDGNEIVRPRLVLKYAEGVLYNKDCCSDCFHIIYDSICVRLERR